MFNSLNNNNFNKNNHKNLSKELINKAILAV